MFALTHVDNETLLEDFKKIAARDRLVTAILLAHIAEIDHRHLYLREGFESMKAYCMARLQLTEDGAKKRIQVARLAREFPQLFPAIANGNLSMFAVRLLATRLNSRNVEELVDGAANLSASELESYLAQRFPLAEVLSFDAELGTQVVAAQEPDSDSGAARHPSPVPDIAQPRTKLAPISADRFTLHATLPSEMHDRLRYAQQLLAHAVPNHDVIEVLDRGLKALIVDIERKRFGVGSRRSKANVRGIPARVKFAVFQRDEGRCVIRLEDGTRCNSDDRIEFDHIIPRAKGGKSTVDNLRLVSRAHNLWAAEQEFGRDFMTKKRNPRKNK